ncbi:MAG: CoA transferase [Deltaproteobacteria bacterium]|nr:CoA transferase [Deltaproteobacteria bacterium]MBW2413525.1 CoA transferase [Deltaproteobacteria bacterium]
MSETDPRDSRDPMAGVFVLDFSQVLAGPYVGRLMADLGADVVKVEAPAGDVIRVIAPKRDRGMSGLYTFVNVGKRNICLDLAKPEGLALAHGLIERADVVIENFRPGVADRLGIGWSDVHARNPRAVMVSISGFGADSPLGDRGAFAPSIHAVTGLLEYHARKTQNPVQPLADARADLTTALHATVAVLAALRGAERTGRGQHIDLAMYDAVLACYEGVPFELLDPPEERYDTDPFDAGDNGWVVVAGPLQHVWAVARERFGLDDPAPRDADIPTKARLRHAALETWMRTLNGRDGVISTLEGVGLACAPVCSLREALTGDFAVERGLLVDVDDRSGGVRQVVRSPWRFSDSDSHVRGPAPRRGEHNDAVLRERLGLDDARLAKLRDAGVVQAASAADADEA